MSDDKRSFTQKLRDENEIINTNKSMGKQSKKEEIKVDIQNHENNIKTDIQKDKKDIEDDIHKYKKENEQLKNDISDQKIDKDTSYIILAAIIIIILLIIYLCSTL